MNNWADLKILNSKKIALQVLLGDNSIPTMPQWVGFSTTAYCNLRCPHCQTHGTEASREIYNAMRWDHDLTLKLAAEALPAADGFCLTLTGEPLATPHFLDLLAKLRPYGAKMHLTTNGSLMSKKVLIQLLTIVSAIDISIDGGTKDVVEAIRLGVEFQSLVNRIRTLTRSYEHLHGIVNFPIRFAYTVMGSNIKDMPAAIHLAHALGVHGVDFYPIQVLDPSVADESVDLYLPLYKAYHARTMSVAKQLGINVNFLLPQYPDVSPDANFSTQGKNLFAKLPIDYYDKLPSPESYLDSEHIELEAAEIASGVRATVMPAASPQPPNGISEIPHGYDKQLQQLSQSADADMHWCLDLDTRVFISPNGDVAPCCMPGRPVFGNVHNETIAEIWNGSQRAEFWKAFHSPLPPDVCKHCRTRTVISKQSLLKRVVPETTLLSRSPSLKTEVS